MTMRPPMRSELTSAANPARSRPAVGEQQVEGPPAGHDAECVAGDHLDSRVRREQPADRVGELFVDLRGDERAAGGHGAGYPPGPDAGAGAEFTDPAGR
jgi:hypothetical protein